MPATYKENGGSVNGSNKVFTYDFPTLQTEDVKVALNGATQATTKYTVSLSPANITFNSTSVDTDVQESDGAPKTGVTVRVFRETAVGTANGNEDPKAVFAAGNSIRAGDLNANFEQALFAIHENQEQPITGSDIPDASITTAKLANLAVDEGNIIQHAVTQSKIGPNSVNGNKIADDSIDSEHYVDGSIDTAHLSNGAVTAEKIADANITTQQIAADAVTNAKIADNSIDSEHYVDGSIDTEHFANGAITSEKIADSNITTQQLATDSVTNSKVADDAIGIDELSATGTPSSSTYLRGDNTWATVSGGGGTYTAGTGLTLSGNEFSVDAIALTTVQEASSQSAQLALTTQEGDVVVRTDENKSYVKNSGTAGTMSDFTLLQTPTGAVLSVNGNTGAITAAQIASAVEAASDSNTFTDADHTKLNGIEDSANNYTHPTFDGDDIDVDTTTLSGATVVSDIDINITTDGRGHVTDANGSVNTRTLSLSDLGYTGETDATADQTGAEIKSAYEGESDTNAFTDAEKTKLSGIATGAEVNVQSDWNSSSGDSQILNKPTVPTNLSDLSDVHNASPSDGQVLKWVNSNSRWEPGTDNSSSGGSGVGDGDKGDITVSNSGDTWTIDNGAITSAKIADANITSQQMAADAISGGNIADDSIDSEHYVDGSIDTAHLANGAVTSEKIADDNITNQQMADDAIGIAELSATGTASSSTYLRGDNTWSTVSATDSTKMPLAGGTFTGSVTFEDAINENVYECTGTELDPDLGTVQYKALGANTTFTESLTTGQSMIIMIDDGSSYTVTWPTIKWLGASAAGSAPTLATSGYTCIELWKVGSDLYGALIGVSA